MLNVKYNCGCEYTLDNGPKAVSIVLCNVHKGMLSPATKKEDDKV